MNPRLSEGAFVQKILVVDDEPTVRAFLEDSLRRGKFDVIQASDGAQALAMAALEKPDLLLLDIRMPGLDGLEVLRRLRASPATRALPVIFLTGTVLEVEELVETLELDPSDFVTKNASSRELVARVRWVLRRNPGT
jgi:DNA-binding response OmpR family regulator